MAGILSSRIAATGLALLLLAGCEDTLDALMGAEPRFDQEQFAGGETASSIVERDVEVPEVFAVADTGLWDGRPSLGGVWVAHPDVTDPERVIIRNQENGTFVIGALFRRERINPGPSFQVSSDAAEALGMLAGSPAALDVVALRREQVPIDPVMADTGDTPADAPPIETAGIESEPLDPIASAAAAIDSADPAAAPAPAPAPAPVASARLEKPFIQIGIFSVEQNARNTATALSNIGIVPTVIPQESQGKPFWRVIVGPATSADERRTVLGQVRELGFDDAYYVTN